MSFIKKLIPLFLLKLLRPIFHGAISWGANIYYKYPSEKLIVIGVTGTNGKTTTVNLAARILQGAGYKVGYTSTATVNIDGVEHLNKMKMTMPSGWVLQKWMKQMVERGCQYAVLEISSEGLAQNRHVGINFDCALVTNLTPEHIESHGGFENYKFAKGKLFESISKSQITKEKRIINANVKKVIITNNDDEHGSYFKSFKSDTYISYGIKTSADIQATEISYSPQGSQFKIQNLNFQIQLKGQFDVYNSLAAIAIAQSQNISLEICQKALGKISVVPGRMEIIQSEPFMVLVDYAYEPEEMRQLYQTISRWPHKRIIQVLGPTGGGRDKARIPLLGKMAAEFADIVIITTDDPYDDNPQDLIHIMADAAIAQGKVIKENLFRNPDRRGAIAKAISLAKAGDIIIITGKGADQKMALANGTYIDWDDRTVAKEELSKLSQ